LLAPQYLRRMSEYYTQRVIAGADVDADTTVSPYERNHSLRHAIFSARRHACARGATQRLLRRGKSCLLS